MKKNEIVKETLLKKALVPLKRLFKMNGNKHSLSSNLQVVPERELPNIFLTYYEHQKIKVQLLNMERMKAQAIQFINQHHRCV